MNYKGNVDVDVLEDLGFGTDRQLPLFYATISSLPLLFFKTSLESSGEQSLFMSRPRPEAQNAQNWPELFVQAQIFIFPSLVTSADIPSQIRMAGHMQT